MAIARYIHGSHLRTDAKAANETDDNCFKVSYAARLRRLAIAPKCRLFPIQETPRGIARQHGA